MSNDIRRKILFSLLFALLIYMALALWSDWHDLTTALLDFPWLWLPLIIGLTLVNYVGRLFKWHWYLRLLGIPIQRQDSARIFGVGMLMVMTPGKAGEFLKSYMVKHVTGTPMAVTAPIVLAERMTDGMAMLLLASVGLFAFPEPTARWVAAIVFVNFILTVLVIQIRPLALRILAFGKHLPLVRRFADHLYSFYESSYLIFRPRNLFISLFIGVVSWVAEGLAYFLVLVGFGATVSAQTVLIAVFIFCISTVIGAVFATPGGLGGVEGSLVALSSSLLSLPTAVATAAALLVRFCTLWLGVSIGVVSFALWPHLLAGSDTVRRADASLQEVTEQPLTVASETEV
ncbi:MAG: flippase-like domain-containing protein [Caldilineaceae bacterium]|nr:flippase-like domain-containing protein [Caldilineaceae bacterium]